MIETRLILSMVLGATGRLDEAWQNIEEAWRIDSLNPRFPHFVSNILYCARRYNDLLQWSTRTAWGPALRFLVYLDLHPDSFLAAAAQCPDSTYCSTLAFAAVGRLAEARDSAARWQRVSDSLLASGLKLSRDSDREALIWTAVGDRNRAFAALEQSFAVRCGGDLPFVKYLPGFDELHDDPRFHDLLRRMRLEP